MIQTYTTVSCKQTSKRLLNGFDNPFDSHVERTVAVHSTGCTTGLTTVLNEQLFVQPLVKPGCTTGLTTGCKHDTAVCQTGCQTGLTTGWMFVYTIQPVVNQLWQPIVSCIQTFTRLSNRFDNRLYRVNGALNGVDFLQGFYLLE